MGTAAPESPFWVEINGRRRTAWTCTPSAIEELVLGRLLTDGYITRPDELVRLEHCDEPEGCIGVRVSIPETNVARVAQERRHVREQGCGLLHFVTCETATIQLPRAAALPDAAALRVAFRSLFTATDAAYPDGGMHAAAVWAGDALLTPCFDVGRHNTVDRALGRALREGVALGAAGLLLSSRVSGAIALKAARAGIGFLASRSIPTTLAEQIAAAGALPIIARAGAGAERSDR
ncbi:MAG TPA: formate dehydrogenase accessory sulfurtransferase FdhD [Longimicrobiales bacterium]|nr:formate dehydrogenase accessory sulfurtransferase FdhD [Longimicrobiales bacterium]